ncbi:helix-turn-helix transcriptional regulator [Lactococcus ileimucosae]|uniref:Helix-turn-helix transcriptional regulator n=1 Tax=Lactococcus ileimucosae TaxID=2941329 RepID=A0ABV4D6L7_9LACT
MIINRLAILLAERNMKAKLLSVQTGIAQSTLTRITSNSSAQIDFDTLNKICNQLKITPNDFFDYTPYDFKVSLVRDDEKKIQEEVSIFVEVLRYGISVAIVEYSGTVVVKKVSIPDNGGKYFEDTMTSLYFSNEQENFLGTLNKAVDNDEFMNVSIPIKQAIFQKVKEEIADFSLDYFHEEAQNEINETVPLLDSQSEVNKFINSIEKQYRSRMNTNLSFYGF